MDTNIAYRARECLFYRKIAHRNAEWRRSFAAFDTRDGADGGTRADRSEQQFGAGGGRGWRIDQTNSRGSIKIAGQQQSTDAS